MSAAVQSLDMKHLSPGCTCLCGSSCTHRFLATPAVESQAHELAPLVCSLIYPSVTSRPLLLRLSVAPSELTIAARRFSRADSSMSHLHHLMSLRGSSHAVFGRSCQKCLTLPSMCQTFCPNFRWTIILLHEWRSRYATESHVSVSSTRHLWERARASPSELHVRRRPAAEHVDQRQHLLRGRFSPCGGTNATPKTNWPTCVLDADGFSLTNTAISVSAKQCHQLNLILLRHAQNHGVLEIVDFVVQRLCH